MRILGTAVKGAISGNNTIGAPSFAQVNPYNLFKHYKSDEFASAYPNIRPTVNELMNILPHAINSNGKPVSHPALDALYHPNKKDSFPLFMEKVGTSVLALDYTYLLVWRMENGKAEPGGNFGFKGNNIAGFTFLESPAITYRDGIVYYSIGSQQFTEDEVIAIPGGVNPDKGLYAGYSPATASARWATLDSYIADFQKGFFENNAIPAGMFVITAASEQDFEDTKKTMQEKHRGAGNNNNVSYVPRPLKEDGKPADSKVEWIPFAQSNKDIDFKPLLEHVDNRLSEAYGVSSIIKGVDSNAKYSNAEVSEAGFAKRAVRPLALRIYSQITHELNRITGGLGVAITFKYEIPAVSDAELVKAKTKREEVAMIKELLALGYSLNSAVDALQLSPAYKLLKLGEGSTVIDNDKPDVDEGDEVDDSPDPTKIDGVTPVNEAAKRKNPKAELTDEERLERAARDFMKSQVDRAVAELADSPLDQEAPTDSEIEDFIVAMMIVITSILIANGESEYAVGAATAGFVLDDLQGFMLDESAESAYRGYLRQVGQSYGNDTAESIRSLLVLADEQGLSRRELENQLRGIMETDDWRVKRLARTELNNSQNIGKLEGMKSLAAETNVAWEKTIQHTASGICPLCASREGIWTELSQPLWSIGESFEANDDKGQPVIYINDWQTNEANDYHPNGRGTLVFRRVE